MAWTASSLQSRTSVEVEPRLLVLDGMPVPIFQGIEPPAQWWSKDKGLRRRDQLVVPVLGATMLDVEWSNRLKQSANDSKLVNVFNPAQRRSNGRPTHQILSATLGVSPDELGALWAEHEAVFTATFTPCRPNQSLEAAFLEDILDKLKQRIKLQVGTPGTTFISKPDSVNPGTPKSTLYFNSFVQVREGRGPKNAPELSNLWVPDTVNDMPLWARFITSDPGSSDESVDPMIGDKPSRPLALV